jgi:glutamate racemase
VHLVITDSGLGGLTICAGIERALRRTGGPGPVRCTYLNAWPEQGRGYNDLPDMAARAAVFDRALCSIDRLQPDLLVIACNTLSIVYEHTTHCRETRLPVRGVVDAGVSLFMEALRREPTAALVLLGTRTTIDAGVHRDRLLGLGIAPARVSGASCHGLATAIERGPRSEATAALIDACADRAAAVRPDGAPLFVGLCCTHYGMVADRLRAAVQARVGARVETLDPNAQLVQEVVASLPTTGGGDRPGVGGAPIAVRVVSKVSLDDAQRQGVAAILEDVSPATAAALLACAHVPDLF